MEINFRKKKLKELCGSKKKLQKSYGKPNAEKIMNSLAYLSSILNLAEGYERSSLRLHQLKGKRKGQYATHLLDGKRVVFEPNHDLVPCKKDGGIHEEKVNKIMIIDMEDYH